MEKKDHNIKPGDSEIVTKKGFLISPPPQKRGKKPLSLLTGKKNSEKTSEKGEVAREKNERTSPKNSSQRQNDKLLPGKNGTENPEKNGAGVSRSNANNRRRPPRPQQDTGDRRTEENNGKVRSLKPNGNGSQKAGAGKPEGKPERKPGGKPAGQNRQDSRGAGNRKAPRPAAGGQKPAGERAGGWGEKKKRPSVLADLGFNSEAFSKKLGEPAAEDTAPEEKVDYSKAIPLRDQIYPPKKEETAAVESTEGKAEIIGIRFKEAGKIYYFDPDGKTVAYGTPVIVETARGVEYGYTAISNRFIPADTIVSPLKKILRLATPEDRERLEANREQEKAAEGVFLEKVEKLKLEMHLVGVEYTFDNSKLLFYFTAEGRVDFRELVKELASVFRTRIELRQVGVRDEAKMMGGLGVCGRPLCCKTFLGEFMQVSIKMAKDQNLSLNSSKISGTCGRLLCCLRYEDEVYQQEYERTPKVDALVETKEGKGVVVEAFPLKGMVKVLLDDKKDAPPQAFPREEVTVVGYRKNNSHSREEEELKDLEKE